MQETNLTCGKGHGPDCLCDVIITTPCVPLNENLLHMWQAPFIAEAMNYSGADGSDADTLEFLETYLHCYDQTVVARTMSDDWFEGTHMTQTDPNRENILAHLRNGTSILDVPALLGSGWTIGRVVQTLTKNTHTAVWEWGPAEWLVFEDVAVFADGAGMAGRALAERMGLTITTLETVCGWYGVSAYRTQRADDTRARKALIKRWLKKDPDLHYKVAYAKLCAHGHTKMSLSSVRNMIHKLKAKETS